MVASNGDAMRHLIISVLALPVAAQDFEKDLEVYDRGDSRRPCVSGKRLQNMTMLRSSTIWAVCTTLVRACRRTTPRL